MGVKTLNFKVNLKSTTPELIYSRHKVYTNDDNAVKLEFAIQDFTAEELTAATASLLLYMRDGSFFQIEDANITKSGSTFSYTLQGTQGKHDGVAQAQLLVTIGAAELATQKYEFEIISGLDQAVAVEVMIQDWTTLTAEARAFIDQAELDEAQRIANENERIAAENQRINDFSSKADKTYTDAELLKKVDKVEGKGLSTNDFDNTYKQKIDTDIPAQLAEIASGEGIENNAITPAKTSFIDYVDTTGIEINEITKATVVNTIAEIQAATVNSFLAGHRNAFNGALEASANYNLLKLFCAPGDSIKSKVILFGLPNTSASKLYYVSFFRADNALISAQTINGNTNASPNITTLKNNGIIAPANTAYAYVNIFANYYNTSNITLYTNGKLCEIVTLNKDKTYTYLESITAQLAAYVPVDTTPGETYYEVNEDLRLPRYEIMLGDIETILASIVEV